MAMLKDLIVGPKKPKEPEMPVVRKPEEERVNPAALAGLVTNAGGAAGLLTPAPTGKKKNLGME